MPLSAEQIRRTLNPVRQDRIESRKQSGRSLSYVPQHEVRAELTRTFGPGNWDSQVHDVTLLYENEVPKKDGNGTNWVACYRAACTLNIRDYEGNHVASFTEYHAEENMPNPNRGEAHAMALTSVESYALRRAAIGLGDNFGLHLYNQGSTAPLVRGTLALTDPASPQHAEHQQFLEAQQRPQAPAQQPQAQPVAQEPAEAPTGREEAAEMIEQAFSATRVQE